VPLHTLKADIDYGFSEAKTTYGVIGVKCWVYRGDRLAHGEAPGVQAPTQEEERRPRRPARPGAPGERRGPSGPGRGGDRDRGAPVTLPRRRLKVRTSRLKPGATRRRARPSSACARPPRLAPAKENKQCCNQHAENIARNRRAATPASPRAVPMCRSATSASRRRARSSDGASDRSCTSRDFASREARWPHLDPHLPGQAHLAKAGRSPHGNGKGNPEYYVAEIQPGKVLYEINGVPEELAREAFLLASAKLPLKTTFVARQVGA